MRNGRRWIQSRWRVGFEWVLRCWWTRWLRCYRRRCWWSGCVSSWGGWWSRRGFAWRHPCLAILAILSPSSFWWLCCWYGLPIQEKGCQSCWSSCFKTSNIVSPPSACYFPAAVLSSSWSRFPFPPCAVFPRWFYYTSCTSSYTYPNNSPFPLIVSSDPRKAQSTAYCDRTTLCSFWRGYRSLQVILWGSYWRWIIFSWEWAHYGAHWGSFDCGYRPWGSERRWAASALVGCFRSLVRKIRRLLWGWWCLLQRSYQLWKVLSWVGMSLLGSAWWRPKRPGSSTCVLRQSAGTSRIFCICLWISSFNWYNSINSISLEGNNKTQATDRKDHSLLLSESMLSEWYLKYCLDSSS